MPIDRSVPTPPPRHQRPGPRYIKSIRLMTDEWEVIEELMSRANVKQFGDLARRAFALLAREYGLEWPN